MRIAPGTIVINVHNPSQQGTVLNMPCRKGRVVVKWDNGQVQHCFEYDIALKETIDSSPDGLLMSRSFSGFEDLRLALTTQRLSGRVDNLIYSLNLTNTKFLAYQFKPVLAFLRSRFQSLLIADEVGLGKTIEAGLIWVELQMREKARKLLVVCPSVLCNKWEMELETKFNIRPEILDASQLHRIIEVIQSGDYSPKSYIISIQGARPNRGWYYGSSSDSPSSKLARFLQEEGENLGKLFDLLILDEAHVIRNSETMSYKFVELIKKLCKHVVMLSATPIQTGNKDLFSLVNMIAPDYFPTEMSLERSITENRQLVELCGELSQHPVSRDHFIASIRKTLDLTHDHSGSGLRRWINNPPSDEALNSLRERSRIVIELRKHIPIFQVMTRTLKSEVLEKRVIREAVVRRVRPTEAEKMLYDIVTYAIRRYCRQSSVPFGFSAVMPQRLVSSSPQAAFRYWQQEKQPKVDPSSDEYLQELVISGEQDDRSSSQEIIRETLRDFNQVEELNRHDSKFEELLTFIKEYRQMHPGKKILLFSFFKKTLHRLHRQLSERGIGSTIYDGDIDRDSRASVIENFKKDDSLILLSSEIAAEGIDLQFMNCVVNYDLPWNPAKLEQRIGRIDRIGQESQKIYIVNFVHKNTIDDLIYTKLLERLQIFTNALGIAEDILGEEISEITRELFTKELTESQIEQVFDQAKRAIENIKLQEENLRKGESIAFNAIQKEVNEAQKMERYITKQDILSYIRAFFHRDGTGSKIYPANPSETLYKIEFSNSTLGEFDNYIHKQSYLTKPTNLQESRQHSVCLRERPLGVNPLTETITQDHPFIGFIDSWLKQNNIEPWKLSAVTLARKKIPKDFFEKIPCSHYFYWVSSWVTKDSSGGSVTLDYYVENLQNNTVLNDDEAEILVNSSSTEGEDWIKFSLLNQMDLDRFIEEKLDRLQETVNRRFYHFLNETQIKHDSDVDFKLRQKTFQRQLVVDKYEEIIEGLKQQEFQGKKGLIAARTEERQKELDRIDKRLAQIEADSKVFSVENFLVSFGFIWVN